MRTSVNGLGRRAALSAADPGQAERSFAFLALLRAQRILSLAFGASDAEHRIYVRAAFRAAVHGQIYALVAIRTVHPR